jgi:hypothetical protein
MSKSKPTRPLTPFERFTAATKQILSVSKEEFDKRESAWRKLRRRKRRGA